MDIINFGEEVNITAQFKQHNYKLFSSDSIMKRAVFTCFKEVNTEKLTAFINTLNGKEGTGSHLVTVPPGPSLADALLSSPILAGEGGSMMGLGASDFEFGVDPSADPELALVRNTKSASERPAQPCFVGLQFQHFFGLKSFP